MTDGPFPSAPSAAPPPPPPPPPVGSGFGGPPPAYSWVATGGRRPRPAWQVALAVIVAGVIVGVAIAIPVVVLHRSGGTGSGNGGGGSGSTSAQALSDYRAAITVMRSAAGFHYVASISGSGGQQTTGDATRHGGRQEITVSTAFGDEHFTLLLVAGTVYFQGNVAALEDQLGVAGSQASNLQNTWISVVSGDGPYATLQVGIDTSDQADETALQPTSVSDVTEADGTSALRLEGVVPPQQGIALAGTGHLDISKNGHRPLVYFTSASQSGQTLTSNVTFGSWGAAPSISAPSGATRWTTLGASAPPGGYGSGGGGIGATPTPQGSI